MPVTMPLRSSPESIFFRQAICRPDSRRSRRRGSLPHRLLHWLCLSTMPLFLQNGLELSAALTGTIMLPASLIAIVAMPFATKVLTTKGEKALALVGVAIMLFGSSVFLNVDANIPLAIVVVFMCIRCFGIAFMNLLTPNTAMAAVPPELSGHASALTNWVRQIVSALIISIASTLINAQLVASNAQTAEEISAAYLSSTSLLYMISCTALLIIIPIALKFFRGQKEM